MYNGYEIAPRPATVQEMANFLLLKCGSTLIQTVGKNWISNFVKWHPQLTTKFSRHYNYECAKFEDQKVIRKWFDCVQNAILQYGIIPEDIYNFDETAMGLIATARVVTKAGTDSQKPLLQPGNHEWVTVIESINALGCVTAQRRINGSTLRQRLNAASTTDTDKRHQHARQAISDVKQTPIKPLHRLDRFFLLSRFDILVDRLLPSLDRNIISLLSTSYRAVTTA